MNINDVPQKENAPQEGEAMGSREHTNTHNSHYTMPEHEAVQKKYARVPDGMKARDQWVTGRIEERDGKKTKVPYDLHTGRRASTTNPTTWGTFNEALSAFATGGYDFIGYVFTKDDPYVGIDVDDYLNPETGESDPDAEEVVHKLNSFTERSFSKTGTHVIVEADKTGTICRVGHYEVYSHGRFFVVTGDHVEGTPLTIERRQRELTELEAELAERKRKGRVTDASLPVSGAGKKGSGLSFMPDEWLLRCARAAANGCDFDMLYNGLRLTGTKTRDGDLEVGYEDDDSLMDAALVAHLLYWTDGDVERTERLFRDTKLMREKWDSPRGDTTYGFYTIGQYSGEYGPPDFATVSRSVAQVLADYFMEHPDELQGRVALVRPQDRRNVIEALDGNIDGRKNEHKAIRRAVAALPPDLLPEDGAGEVANHRVVMGNDGKFNRIEAVPIKNINDAISRLPGGAPMVACGDAFVDEDNGIRVLDTPDKFFTVLKERGPVKWRKGTAANGEELVTHRELFEHTLVHAEKHTSIELFPHYPSLGGVYYRKQPKLEGYEPTGKYLNELLGFFTNVEKDFDRVFLRALFLTPYWGGNPGTRPVFVIQAHGHGWGKTAVTKALGLLYGGIIDLDPGDRRGEGFVSRLFSAEGLTKRLARVDNFKLGFESPLFEHVATTDYISGHKLYVGEATRMNNLTYVLTGKGMPKFSPDMSGRVVPICLTKPDYTAAPSWERDLVNLCKTHQYEILADIEALLAKQTDERGLNDRWSGWGNDVLAKCTDNVEGALTLIGERRGEQNAERDELDLVKEAFMKEWELGTEQYFISSTDLADRYNTLANARLATNIVSHTVKEFIAAGLLHGIKADRNSQANGFSINGPVFFLALEQEGWFKDGWEYDVRSKFIMEGKGNFIDALKRQA